MSIAEVEKSFRKTLQPTRKYQRWRRPKFRLNFYEAAVGSGDDDGSADGFDQKVASSLKFYNFDDVSFGFYSFLLLHFGWSADVCQMRAYLRQFLVFLRSTPLHQRRSRAPMTGATPPPVCTQKVGTAHQKTHLNCRNIHKTHGPTSVCNGATDVQLRCVDWSGDESMRFECCWQEVGGLRSAKFSLKCIIVVGGGDHDVCASNRHTE